MTDSAASAPLAVQFGAGNIGRGFMGELFARSGYRTVFIEVDGTIVEAMNRRGSYEIHHISNAGDEPVTITGVRAVSASQADAAARAVAGASLACTAVGVRVLRAVAPTLARGIALRIASGSAAPLNVITCENLVGAGRFLRDLVWDELERASPTGPYGSGLNPPKAGRLGDKDRMAGGSPPLGRDGFDARFGFVEAVVSRMVPIVPDDVRRRDPLWVACEPYARLPVDATAFRGPVPHIIGMEPVDNILAYQRRKLASHNMSHALCAYLGYPAGHEFIWQAMADPKIVAAVRGAMDETGRALGSRFAFPAAVQRAYEEDLLERYRNRALGDQVRRVGADPLRKLGPEDRLIASARLCLEEGIDPAHVILGIRAALAYDHPEDPAAHRLHEMLRTGGLAHVLREVCGLAPDEPLYARLMEPA